MTRFAANPRRFRILVKNVYLQIESTEYIFAIESAVNFQVVIRLRRLYIKCENHLYGNAFKVEFTENA